MIHESDPGRSRVPQCFGRTTNPVLAVLASQDEIDAGRHYEQAINLAQDLGYHGPMICFDADEPSAILAAAKALNLVPQVVAVDFTGGQVNSVRCDAGEIKVVCYDESDTDEYSAAVVDLPVGDNGSLVKCWAHAQTADVDPGLAKARD